MARRYYDGYNTYHKDFQNTSGGEVIIPESTDAENNNESISTQNESVDSKINSFNFLPDLGGLFPNFALDDVILLGILIVLLHDGTDDNILLIIIGFLFLTGLKR